MKHFKLVDKDVPVDGLLEEVTKNHELWFVDTTRQETIDKQRETYAITLRSHADQAQLDSRVRRAMPFGYKGRPSAMTDQFPVASKYVDDFIRDKRGKPGRVVMTNLRPNGTIYPHTDDGLYWLLRDRYHLVIKSAKGSHFKAGGEEVRMQEGELWWFDPTVEHEAFNDSDEDRIHIIIDVLSADSMRTFARRVARAPLRTSRAFFNAAIRAVAWRLRRQRLAEESAPA